MSSNPKMDEDQPQLASKPTTVPEETNSLKLIVVTGATGSQGGGVVKHLLKNTDKCRIRAVTRKPDSEKALKLKE